MMRQPPRSTRTDTLFPSPTRVRSRTGENRLGHVLADLAPVDVPRRDDIDIARPVSGHIPVDEADSFVCPAIGIVRDALNERTGTVADTDDCYLYSHEPISIHHTSDRDTLFS